MLSGETIVRRICKYRANDWPQPRKIPRSIFYSASDGGRLRRFRKQQCMSTLPSTSTAVFSPLDFNDPTGNTGSDRVQFNTSILESSAMFRPLCIDSCATRSFPSSYLTSWTSSHGIADREAPSALSTHLQSQLRKYGRSAFVRRPRTYIDSPRLIYRIADDLLRSELF